ncbi:MAG: hypothetical protein PHI32_03040 [Dysgonamonadaceae bacterium]|nr:hypothetical protein [Dysgonamonadaceae bacterium]MDD4728208.1 hypothetical protein [Dysgonamonadaceae bacterium]
MKEWNDILEKLRASINEQGIDSFHIIEELVPIEEQMEYFKYFDKLRGENKSFVRNEEIATLFSPDASIAEKKKSLVLLSSIPDVKAYRSIETYQSSPLEPELKNWSSIALVGSRIILNSELSGKQQVFISSGLGGHNNKLRFFSLFTSPSRENFSDLQKEIIDREFKFQLENNDVDLEVFDIKSNYFSILMLFSFDMDVRAILKAAIDECNKYGDFIENKFLFTNVKVLSDSEIQQFLIKKSSIIK